MDNVTTICNLSTLILKCQILQLLSSPEGTLNWSVYKIAKYCNINYYLETLHKYIRSNIFGHFLIIITVTLASLNLKYF